MAHMCIWRFMKVHMPYLGDPHAPVEGVKMNLPLLNSKSRDHRAGGSLLSGCPNSLPHLASKLWVGEFTRGQRTLGSGGP